MARRRAGHYLQGSRTSLLSAQSYLFRDYRLVVSVSLPGSPENLSRLKKDAAAAIGMGDPYQFSRAFKRIHGLSPRAFQQYRRGHAPDAMSG